MTKYETIKQHTDDFGSTASHIINTATGLSEKSIAAGVLLLSTIPEFYGLVGATGNRAVAIAAALISLALVKTAIGTENKHFLGIPYNHFWLIYAAVLAAELAFIAGSGAYLDMGLIVFSFGGAVCSESIAKVVKAEMEEAKVADLQATKEQVKLDEFTAKSQARTAAYVAKHAPAVESDRNLVANDGTDKATITAEKAAIGGEKGRQTRTSKAQQRQSDLYQTLIEQYPGVELHQIKYSKLAEIMNVSANTAKRDIAALRDAGRINGRVPEGV